MKDAFFNSLFESSEDDETSLLSIEKWISGLDSLADFQVEEIPFSRMRSWAFDRKGCLRHESGRFFSIQGFKYKDRKTGQKNCQPIIDQPEHGILGIITQIRNGVQYFLLQAKIEPGNIGTIQLSPTVQATKSNYTKVHKGNAVSYLEYFVDDNCGCRDVTRALQSEHGYKFYRKANYNIIVSAPEEMVVPVLPNFRWFTFREIMLLLKQNNRINMDTRSVLASLPFDCFSTEGGVAFAPSEPSNPVVSGLLRSFCDQDALQKNVSASAALRQARKKNRFSGKMGALDPLYRRGWTKTENHIFSDTYPDFDLIAIRTTVEGREVRSWDQPIVRDNTPKTSGFLVKIIDGVCYFLVQLCEEICSFHGAELGPTLHNATDCEKGSGLPYAEYFFTPTGRVLYDTIQSEEGGRFYQQENRYMLVLTEEDIPEDEGYLWVSGRELKQCMRENCAVNIEARTLVSCVPFI